MKFSTGSCASEIASFLPVRQAHATTRRVRRLGTQTIRLNVEESRRLMDALLAPPHPATASMKRALKQYKKSVISDVD